MDDRYEAFSMADPLFYDAMHSVQTAGESFALAGRELPEGWRRYEQDDWFVFHADNARPTPAQGWKIHASASVESAEKVLEAVWEYCMPRDIGFKFLRSSGALAARVSKYAPRGYSGKLVTIYPADDAQCETLLNELGAVLDGTPNPYILSDLRWGEGPLFVRYGAFTNRFGVDDKGEVVPVIETPDGTLVPDRRDPVFYVPDWVTLPDFLKPAFAARNAVTVGDLPYTIEKVLHFSNGGGIYAGRDTRTGEQVVLKEGRPHAGLDSAGHDAVRRVEHEHAILTRLAGIPGVPRVHDLFWLGEHRFMVMEHVEGDVLSRAIVLKYPLIDATATDADFAEFTEWAVSVHAKVEETIEAIHDRGIVYGDLHLFNIMVGAEGEVRLLDFEVASTVESGTRAGLGNQGFAAPRSMSGIEADRYALACLRLALFLPMTNLLWLHRPKARHFAEIISEHFPVDPAFLDKGVAVIAPPTAPAEEVPVFAPDPAAWPALRDGMTRAIMASATPGRDDRLYPGDVQQFAVGGLGLAYGAAGVLYALASTGAGRFPEHEEWLRSRALNPPGGTRPGLYDGLHGVAFALERLDRRQDALDVLDICLREDWESLGPDLSGGLSGVGLNLLDFGARTGESTLTEAGMKAAALVAERAAAEDGEATMSGGTAPWAGLMRGRSGQAMLLLRAFDLTGDRAYLDVAATALRADLRCCLQRENGSLEVNEGWRTMPYLDVGSTGVGLALDAYLRRAEDEPFAEALGRIDLAASSTMYILPGLFSGRAGILAYLASRSKSPLDDEAVLRQLRGLPWHALPYAGGIAYPGTGLMRLSMDIATGTAGILLAVGSVLSGETAVLPLLDPSPAPMSPASPRRGQ
ncbi:class III lanthionine synthetase LanKC [Phytomonospora sp. NPDC050363]|uniref:class III lanthionine synthetase LanKC n=1 Tax=Phytomonospora sp. NPDC050363 TaxID=3155642 RepID=UPI0033CB6F89